MLVLPRGNYQINSSQTKKLSFSFHHQVFFLLSIQNEHLEFYLIFFRVKAQIWNVTKETLDGYFELIVPLRG